MRPVKMVALAAALAISLVGVTSASAAQFTASAVGELTGKATSTQKLTTGAGTIECTTAATSGSITSIAASEQAALVVYGGCRMLGFITAEVSPANYVFTSTGEVRIAKPITIKLPLSGCSIVIRDQTVSSVSFTNAGETNVMESSSVSGILSVGSGGICGGSSSVGQYSGNSEISRVGGGTLRFDP
jgi:hypothetical protein